MSGQCQVLVVEVSTLSGATVVAAAIVVRPRLAERQAAVAGTAAAATGTIGHQRLVFADETAIGAAVGATAPHIG